MAYIGNVPAEKYTALTQQTFSSPTGTSFTLSQAVTNSVDIDLYIDNVKQDPASYSVSGTALTTSTIASPSTMYCIFNGKAMQTVNPPDGSVGTAKVTDDAITLAKLAPGTDGNIISYDASGNPVAIATGSDGQVLTSTGAGSPPAFETISRLVSETGSFTRDISTATGSQAITGVGFQPTALIMFVGGGGAGKASWGMASSDASEVCVSHYHNVTADSFEHWGNLIRIEHGSGVNYQGNLTSFDADGFTIAWTKNGSPTGTVGCKFIAFK